VKTATTPILDIGRTDVGRGKIMMVIVMGVAPFGRVLTATTATQIVTKVNAVLDVLTSMVMDMGSVIVA
jgi:hypothetical protein